MQAGAKLVLKTVKAIEADNVNPTPQNIIAVDDINHAPKIFRENCRINWHVSAQKAHNLVRGLSPYPAAYTVIKTPDGKEADVKIFKTKIEDETNSLPPGTIVSNNKTYLKVHTGQGVLSILELQPATKRRMKIAEYLAGNKITEGSQFI